MHFKQKDYKKAMAKYSRVLLFTKQLLPADAGADQMMSMIPGQQKLDEQGQKEVVELQAATFLNMSTCHFLQKDFKKSVDKASESIKLQRTIKAYYRRGKAYAGLD